ncbi:MAG: adenylate/guanylate cyclase domain-containing protein [Candidatus Cloacimonetes bacterium]|nr:adenylate/guanylate cyclase domain-containing protein [Candidatus Cloacimonadota bacterium]
MKSHFNDTYDKEIEILKDAQSILENEDISKENLLDNYKILIKNYKKLLKILKTISRIGDNQQHRLNSITERLGRYVSYQLFKKITQGKEKVKIKTTRKKLTVFFSDIKDFSSISSNSEGEALSTFLNLYLEEMTKIINKWGGTLDKYIGDAIMVFWGDPYFISDEYHALRCVSMAIEMKHKMKDLQKIWFEQGYQEPLHIRIGIATGFCTVGNFGSSERMDYTIIGNAVNLASRLESHAEVDEIYISHETWGLVKDKISCAPYVSLDIKGFHQKQIVHKVLGFKTNEKSVENTMMIDSAEKGIKVEIDFAKAEQDTLQKIVKIISKKLEN